MDELNLYEGAWSGPEIDAAIGRSARISNPNLLDNWYFVGGGSYSHDGHFPINQRGKTTGSVGNNVYDIDRWKWAYRTSAGSWSLVSGGLRITPVDSEKTCYLNQIPNNYAGLDGKQLTFSALFADGTLASGTALRVDDTVQVIDRQTGVVLSLNTTYVSIAFSEQMTIVAAKLELGNAQTLAHQEEGVWILNEIPDFASELEKCQRYFFTVHPLSNTHILNGLAASSTEARFTTVTPVTMYKGVSPSYYGDTPSLYSNTALAYRTASSVAVSVIGPFALISVAGSGMTAGEPLRLIVPANSDFGISVEP